jgi:hypothetical protein
MDPSHLRDLARSLPLVRADRERAARGIRRRSSERVSAFVGPRLPEFFQNIQVNYCTTLSAWDVNGTVEVRLW